jgi:hypothetical protein
MVIKLISMITECVGWLFDSSALLYQLIRLLIFGDIFWYWRKMEKISWSDHVRNKEVLLRARRRGISYMKHVKGRRI